MTDYLLDTNHASAMLTDGHPLRQRIQQRIRYGDTFSMPMVVVTEMIYGLLALPRARQNLQTWKDIHIMFTFYEVDIYDAEDAAYLQHDLRLNGKHLETVDALIATIAIRYDLILLTRDHDFDAVPGLSIENWYE